MAKRVTEKQRQVLKFIAEYIDQQGYSPAIRDVASAFSCSVKGAYDHVVALEKKGLIDRARNRSRSILLSPRGKGVLRIAEPKKVPLYGKIAAGQPTYADQYIEEFVSLPLEGMADDSAQLFALRVSGDSMINAGIREGDIAIFREQPMAATGDIVAAMVEDEATVKYYFEQGGRVVLKAANSLYPDMYFTELRILGRMKSLIRLYD